MDDVDDDEKAVYATVQKPRRRLSSSRAGVEDVLLPLKLVDSALDYFNYGGEVDDEDDEAPELPKRRYGPITEHEGWHDESRSPRWHLASKILSHGTGSLGCLGSAVWWWSILGFGQRVGDRVFVDDQVWLRVGVVVRVVRIERVGSLQLYRVSVLLTTYYECSRQSCLTDLGEVVEGTNNFDWNSPPRRCYNQVWTSTQEGGGGRAKIISPGLRAVNPVLVSSTELASTYID